MMMVFWCLPTTRKALLIQPLSTLPMDCRKSSVKHWSTETSFDMVIFAVVLVLSYLVFSFPFFPWKIRV